MARLNDEDLDRDLMALADNALDRDARSQVESLVAADPDARRRLSIFRATGAGLSEHFEGPMNEPVPPHLIEFVMTYGNGRAVNATPAPLISACAMGLFARLRDRLIPDNAGWHLAVASAVALIAGLSAGAMLGGVGQPEGASGNGLIAATRERVLAWGALKNVLESSPMDQAVRVSDGASEAAVMRATFTFKGKDGGYCRQYKIEQANKEQFAGFACREPAGNWALQVNIPEHMSIAGKVNAESGKYAPVDGPQEVTIDGAVERLTKGDALDPAVEAAAIAQGWK